MRKLLFLSRQLYWSVFYESSYIEIFISTYSTGLSINAAAFAQNEKYCEHELFSCSIKNLAQEVQTKVSQQRNILKSKPRISFLAGVIRTLETCGLPGLQIYKSHLSVFNTS